MDPLLKQRLVGAAVLIGLAVIFVPMVLDGPVERTGASQPAGIPLALPAERGVAHAAEAPPQPQPDAQPQPRLIAASATTAPSLQRQPSAPAGYAVQLGSFSSAGNAETLAQRIREQGFDAFVQEVDVATGKMYRVRIGPLGSRGAAENLASRVQRDTGERAVVVPHP